MPLTKEAGQLNTSDAAVQPWACQRKVNVSWVGIVEMCEVHQTRFCAVEFWPWIASRVSDAWAVAQFGTPLSQCGPPVFSMLWRVLEWTCTQCHRTVPKAEPRVLHHHSCLSDEVTTNQAHFLVVKLTDGQVCRPQSVVACHNEGTGAMF